MKKTEPKKPLEVNEDNYMLRSDLLRAAKRGERNSPILNALDSFIIFMFSISWLIFLILIWGLLANGGPQTFIVYVLFYIILGIIALLRADSTEAFLRLKFASLNSWGSAKAYNNTMKEYDFLEPKLRECEKIKDPVERKKAYDELVVIMDVKYGRGNHLIGLPYTEKEKAEERQLRARIQKIKKEVENFKGEYND